MNSSQLFVGVDAKQIAVSVPLEAACVEASPRLRRADRDQILLEPCVFISRGGTAGTAKEDREGGKEAKAQTHAQAGKATLDGLVPHEPPNADLLPQY